MRRLLIGIGIAVVVIIVGLVLAVSLINVNKYRPQIQAQVEKAIHRNVTLGKMSLSFFPLGAKIDKLMISEDPNFGSNRPFATANDVSAGVGFFSLLKGSPEVRTIHLKNPQVELIRNAQGKWNFASMVPEKKDNSKTNVTISNVEIEDGQVAYTDAVRDIPRTVYDHIDMALSGTSATKPFDVNVSAHLPGPGKQLLSLKSQVGPLPQDGSYAAIPVDGKVSFEEVTLAGFNKFASGALPPKTDGTVSGEVDLKSSNETLAADGHLKLVDTTIKGSKIEYPIETTFNVSDNRKTDRIDIKSADLKLGSTPFSMSGTIDSSQKPAILDVKLSTKNASITDLAKLAGSFGVAFNPSYQAKGQITADITAKGPSTKPQLAGKIEGRDVSVSGGEIKQPVQIASIDLDLTPDSITTSPFTAVSGSTKVDAKAKVTNYTSKVMNVDGSLKTQNADIAELVNMAKAYGVDAANGMSGSGKLSLDVQVQGPTNKLNYSGNGSISGATVNAPAVLTKPVSVSSANLKFAQNSASVSDLAMSVGSTSMKGNLSAKNFTAPDVTFQLAADKINSAELQQLTAVPKKEDSTPAAAKDKEPSLLTKTTGGGSLSAGTIVANDFTLTNVKTNVKLNKGLITLSPLTADIYGGKEAGTITLDTRPANAQVAVKAKLNGVDSNALLSAVSAAKDTLYGSLGATSDVSFALLPGNELPKTLNGTMSFNVANGELKHVNVMNEISKIAKFLNPGQANTSGNDTKLTKLSGSMDIKDGAAHTDDLVAAIDAGSVSAKGIINLATQALNLDATAVLKSGLTKSVGGTNVGGFLNTALANNQGELVVPVKIGGTLQKPSFAPDAAAMAQMKVKNLLPSVSNPTSGVVGSILENKGGGGGAVKSILGGLAGGDKKADENGKQQQQPEEKPKPEDAIKGILKGFGKKKQ